MGKKYTIARAVDGISLNGKEYVMTDEGDIMRIPLAKTGIYACGVSQQTGVASAKPGTAKQENSRLVDLYRFLLAE